jgi:hypothetical protein
MCESNVVIIMPSEESAQEKVPYSGASEQAEKPRQGYATEPADQTDSISEWRRVGF